MVSTSTELPAVQQLICDTVNLCLLDEMQTPFADVFDDFDDLCPMKAPLEVTDGVQFDFKKHFLAVLSDEERARWTTLTIDHIKWKYVNAIDHGVNKSTILIFGKLPKKIWPDFHKTALDQAIELFRMEGRDVQFEQTFLTCSHFSKSFYHHVSGEEVCGMQTAILHSQGNLLIRKEVNYIQRYISDNRKSKYGKNTSKNFFGHFSTVSQQLRGWRLPYPQ